MVKMETTEQVLHALRKKYSSGAYAFLTQVGNATGFSCNRWADAIVMSLWPSRGLELIGFEIKISRSDWVKELKNPGKADIISRYCDSWYLVVGDESIIQLGELPMGWGLMIPQTKNNLKVTLKCERKIKPKPIDKHFLAAILRRATEQLTEDAKLRREYSRGYDGGLKEGKERMQYSLESGKNRVETLEKKIKDFEEASGVEIDNWHHKPSKIGDAVRVVVNGSYIQELTRLQDLQRRAESCAKSIGEEIQKHKELDI